MSDLIERLRVVGGVGDEAVDLIEQKQRWIAKLEQHNNELAATVERLRDLFNIASGDIKRLFELQPQNMSDGSYEVDGQSVTELGLAFQATTQQNLNVVKRESYADGFYFCDTKTGSMSAESIAEEANERYPDKD